MRRQDNESAELTRSSDDLDPVCEFYTSHPFPPPVENLDRARDEWRDENRLRSEFHLLWPNKQYRGDLDVLVAGCGTWQAAKYALCHPAARVIGIDLSPTSLDHTEQLKRKYNLTNLETRKLAIEDIVTQLDHQFELIICTGVLHHLKDPDEGLRALRSALKPDGAIYLMVYAPYGRAGVYMLQEYCRRLAIGTSTQEINDLIAVLKVLPSHHPLLATQRGSRDFYTDALADALLNPRDRAYSVPQLFGFIERNELTFGRWYWQAPYLPQCGDLALTPHANRLAALAERERYAAMELWRGLMPNHSLVVHRADVNNDGFRVRFDDENYLRYVPIRLPWTICVQERLPAGAAGVLLNQTHLFEDLILFIDHQEKRMFDLIDGHRSIAEIVDRANGDGGTTQVRTFFEKLWWYDQVIFDASYSEG